MKVLTRRCPAFLRAQGEIEHLATRADQGVRIRLRTTPCDRLFRQTMQEGIERFAKGALPTIRAVEAVK